MAGGGAVAREGEHVAEGLIAKAAKDVLRDSEVLGGKAAAREGEQTAARTVAHEGEQTLAQTAAHEGEQAAGDAGTDAARNVDLDSLPDYHNGGQPDLFGSENVPGDYDPYAGQTRQEFYNEHWDPAANDGKGNWDYPKDDGFAEPPRANTLQNGDVIDRYGFPSGTYTSPNGTDFAQRALPPTNLTAPYYRYEVVRELPATVTEGRIAPAFGQVGGGLQHFFDRSIDDYVERGYLRQVYP